MLSCVLVQCGDPVTSVLALGNSVFVCMQTDIRTLGSPSHLKRILMITMDSFRNILDDNFTIPISIRFASLLLFAVPEVLMTITITV